MSDYVFAPAAMPALPVVGQAATFPIHRIFCVGRNYAAHAAEMGNEVDREAPFYFTKSAHALLQSGADMPYPPGTNDLHHEVEMVVAIGKTGAGVAKSSAMDMVWGYGVGLDMTRRDLQGAAKDKRRPWDIGKDFEGSAVLGPLTPAAAAGDIFKQSITLAVNGETRQSAPLTDMVWSVPELIAHLSTLYTLRPGDLIMTGTPAGVGAVVKGDALQGGIDGLAGVATKIT